MFYIYQMYTRNKHKHTHKIEMKIVQLYIPKDAIALPLPNRVNSHIFNQNETQII